MTAALFVLIIVLLVASAADSKPEPMKGECHVDRQPDS